MRIVAIPVDDDPALNDERKRLRPWCGPNGYQHFGYADVEDLLGRLPRVLAGEDLEFLEVVAHGNPLVCDGIHAGNAADVGARLKRVRGFGRGTRIYLSGCNTGLDGDGSCIARLLANAAGCTVYGSVGYLFGSQAERSARVIAGYTENGIEFTAYPGAEDGTGDACWRVYRGLMVVRERGLAWVQAPRTESGPMTITVKHPGRTTHLLGSDASALRAILDAAMAAPGKPMAALRIAPDATLTVDFGGGPRQYDVLSRGAVLRDPASNEVWQVPQADRIRELLGR